MVLATTTPSLTKIDFEDNTKQVAVTNVDLGFGIKYGNNELKKTTKVTDAQVLRSASSINE